mgnify:CR=1 FL=1
MTNILTLPRITAFCLAFLLNLGLVAQSSYQKIVLKNIQPVGSFEPGGIEQKYAPSLQPQEMPHPDGELDRNKASRLPLIKDFSKMSNDVQLNANTPRPEVLDSLGGNNYSGSVPNDDDFAIGRNGQILRVRNSTIGAYDYTKDSLLYESTLFRFYRPQQFLPGSKYDPRALYDPFEDRFIVLYLSGNTWENSKIILGFSKSSDLADGFNIYQLDGNPLNDSTWSDYPHISINEKDLFITMNTFYNGSSNNSGYVQSTIRQVSKNPGYDSLALTEHYYYNIKSGNRNLFNFSGIDLGDTSRLQNRPQYLISNRNLDSINDSIFVAEILGDALGNPQFRIRTFTTETPYGLPPEARQANDHKFDCNDSRIQGAVLHNGLIQFVGNTITSTGNSGIYHGIIDRYGDSTNIYFKIINMDPIDIGYPQVTYTGKSRSEVESIISFNHTGDSLNAGFSCLFFDNDYTYSYRKQIVEGGDYIDIISSNGNRKYERWGDYTGNQQDYNESSVAWASGYQATSNGQPLTVIAKLRSPNWSNSPIVGLKEEDKPKVELSPNPAQHWFQLSIERQKEELLYFELIGMDAKQSVFKVEEQAFAGSNTFRFKTDFLSPGLYLLQVKDSKGAAISTKRIVIQ